MCCCSPSTVFYPSFCHCFRHTHTHTLHTLVHTSRFIVTKSSLRTFPPLVSAAFIYTAANLFFFIKKGAGIGHLASPDKIKEGCSSYFSGSGGAGWPSSQIGWLLKKIMTRASPLCTHGNMKKKERLQMALTSQRCCFVFDVTE